jgi:hypothetical protein
MLRAVEGVDHKSPLAGVDLGEVRDARVKPCLRHAWCIEAEHHAGSCTLQVGRTLYEPHGDKR